MSETLKIALITFASGAVGSFVGLLGVIISSAFASRAKMKQTVIQEQFKIRTQAYQLVFETHTALSASENDLQKTADFLSALHKACIVSSPSASAALLIWENTFTNKRPLSEKQSAMTSALISMQRDLDNFTEPRILRNKWPRKPPKPQVPQT